MCLVAVFHFGRKALDKDVGNFTKHRQRAAIEDLNHWTSSRTPRDVKEVVVTRKRNTSGRRRNRIDAIEGRVQQKNLRDPIGDELNDESAAIAIRRDQRGSAIAERERAERFEE